MGNIREELLADYSKNNISRVVKLIGSDQELFGELMAIYFKGQKHVNLMAAWAVRFCFEAHPFLIEPYISEMVKRLKIPQLHPGIKRSILKILEDIDMSSEYFDEIADACFDFLSNPKETAAVRIYSMEILYKLSLKFPELQNEIALIIEDQIPYGTPGFQNRGKKIIQKIRNKDKEKDKTRK